MELVDTHCHIHDSEFAEKNDLSSEEILNRAIEAGVNKLICVGTSVKSSKEAEAFSKKNENCYFSVAVHPHEAENYTAKQLENQIKELESIVSANPTRLVAIGECGLDYFYHGKKEVMQNQEKLFRLHIELAVKYKLPMIFHIRSSESKTVDSSEVSNAFNDFFRIIDEYSNITGVVHSFSATKSELDGVLKRGFYVGLNGIITFTKDEKQLEAAREVPVKNLLIETDAPFLTPKPFRGTINEPKHVINITKFLSELRDESQAFLAKQTTENAKQLFNL